MSLIVLAERLRTGRSMARTLLLLIALTGAVIVGLLAMHSLNTHVPAETDHHTAVTAVTGASVDDHHVERAASDEPCLACGSGHDSDIVTMACVLALLATVLLLARPRTGQGWPSVPPPQSEPDNALRIEAGLHPPSLVALGISRT